MTPTLSPREQEAMARHALGAPFKVVAADMGLTYQSTKNLYLLAARRLGVSSSIEVFRELGWLHVPDEAMTWRTQP